VTIFRTELSSEMGLKSLAVIGVSIFGIRVIKEEFILSKDIFSS
jgi:hypothetical protein